MNDSIEILKHTGKLVGVKRDADYDFVERDIRVNDKILLYTDGLFEQFNDRDESFTENDILNLVKANKSASIDELNSIIINRIKEFLGAEHEISMRDDITIIGIEINDRRSTPR